MKQALPLRHAWIAFALTSACALAANTPADIARNAGGIWSLDPAGSMQRWVVVHGPGEAESGAILHIEVLGKAVKAPAWAVKRLAPHMAITPEALAHSVLKPVRRGLVYPEAYEEGRARWEAQHQEGRAPICSTSVDRCLRGEW